MILFLGDTIVSTPDFSENFQQAYNKWTRYLEHEQQNKKMMSFEDTEAGKKIAKSKKRHEEAAGITK
jgi:hypothetical protein